MGAMILPKLGLARAAVCKVEQHVLIAKPIVLIALRPTALARVCGTALTVTIHVLQVDLVGRGYMQQLATKKRGMAC